MDKGKGIRPSSIVFRQDHDNAYRELRQNS